jgi:carbamate kinase
VGKKIVIALGGNALIEDKEHQTVPDQFRAAAKVMSRVANLVEKGYQIVLTHGNGPQVGFIMMRVELARTILHAVPLDSCVADTQGSIGYNFQLALNNEFKKRGIAKPVSTVVTQVVVDKDDLAFKNPTKPIGPFFTKEEALNRKKFDGWNVMDDAGRGWRRSVASPIPLEIIEIDAIRKLYKEGFIVIAGGGGGIPVIKDDDGNLKGASAVIDKDYTAEMIATILDVDLFLISTNIGKVYLNFGKADQVAIDKMTVAEAKKYIKEGQFSKGSMLPKIKAMINFVEKNKKEAIITARDLEGAIEGKSGTKIVP